MANQARKYSLIAELDSARAQLTDYTAAVRRDLDIGARLKAGFARNPTAWFGAAAVCGVILSRIPSSRRKVVVKGPATRNQQAGKAAFVLAALKFGLDFAKPAITGWVGKKMRTR